MAKLTPDQIFRFHLSIIALLGLAFGCVVFADVLGHHRLMKISNMFRLEREGNVPSFFSAIALLAAALTANAVRMKLPIGTSERHGWAIFACAFLFMGIDEAVSIHELITLPHRLRHIGEVSDYFYYAGIFPYLLFSLWLAIYLFPFWLSQGKPVRNGIAVGGMVYVMAAIGMELVENKLTVAHVSPFSLSMAFNFAAEELGEMLAVALFLKAFLTRLAELGGGNLLPVVIAAQPFREARSDRAQIAQALASMSETDLRRP